MRFGVITALPLETAAVLKLLRDVREVQRPGDSQVYTVGSLSDSGETIVLAGLTRYANNAAAASATNMVRSFPELTDIIFVGIAAGVPKPSDPNRHVRLGDILVSTDVVQFDRGSQLVDRFEVRGTSPLPSAALLQMVNRLDARILSGQFEWAERYRSWAQALGVKRPTKETKRFRHPPRPAKLAGVPKIHRGVIGASNTLLRDATRRDALAERHRLIGVEMEASGLADATWEAGVGYLVVRGVSDYGDSAKDDVWQPYAAQVAAVYLAELLGGTVSNQTDVREANGKETGRRFVIGDRLTAVSWNAKGSLLAAGGFTGEVFVLDDALLPAWSRQVTSAPLRALAWHGDSVLAADDHGSISLVGPASSRVLGSTSSPIYRLIVSPSDGRLYSLDRVGRLTEWSLTRQGSASHGAANLHMLRQVPVSDRPLFDGIVLSNGTLALVGAEGELTIVERTTLLISHRLQVSRSGTFAVCSDGNGDLWIGAADGTMSMVSLATGAPMLGASGVATHTDALRSICLGPGGEVITASKDGTLKSWVNGSFRSLIYNAGSYLYDIALHPQRPIVAVVDGGGSVAIVDLAR